MSGKSDRPSESDTISTDERFQLLAVERRRVVLDVLTSQRRPTDLEELARAVALREGTHGRTVAVSLHHHHLPLMDEIGALEYDTQRRQVTAYHASLVQSMTPFVA